jgi:hypothetical protein
MHVESVSAATRWIPRAWETCFTKAHGFDLGAPRSVSRGDTKLVAIQEERW